MRGWPRMLGRAALLLHGQETSPPADTETLVARLCAGDAAALEPLYRRESGPVYRYALALAGNPAWAADAMQDAFVAFAGRPQGFDPQRASLGAYLAGMARHSLLARWREAPAAAPDEQAETDGEMPAADHLASPEELLVRSQAQEQVWAALQRLPWTQREAVVLVDLQERPYAEAARIAGVEINTLRTRLHRARLRLAALLNTAEPGARA